MFCAQKKAGDDNSSSFRVTLMAVSPNVLGFAVCFEPSGFSAFPPNTGLKSAHTSWLRSAKSQTPVQIPKHETYRCLLRVAPGLKQF